MRSPKMALDELVVDLGGEKYWCPTCDEWVSHYPDPTDSAHCPCCPGDGCVCNCHDHG